MNVGNLDIKTEFFGLRKSDVSRYFTDLSDRYKAELDNLQKQIRSLKRTKATLIEELETVKKNNEQIVPETEKSSSADIKISSESNKKVSKTIMLIEAIADQKIDDMVQKAEKQMVKYDEQLVALKNETEETREKIENLLKQVVGLLNIDFDEKTSKVKVIKLPERRDKATDTPKKEERKEISEEVESSIRSNFKKYNEIKDIFAQQLQATLDNDNASEQNGAVMLLQINDFIIANYMINCSTGNILVNDITAYIKSLKYDAYVQRLSYDNIGIIITGINDVYRLSQFAKKIQTYIEKGIQVEGKKIELSSNMGIAKFPNDSKEAYIIINYAGIALYKAKELGKNTYQFIDGELIEKIKFVNELKEDFITAIRNEEIVLHYQPQISLKNNDIFGFESLLRWKNDKYNKVAILELINMAEKENFINEIGFQLFRKSCIFAREFEKKYNKRKIISINFSAMQLNSDNFVEKVVEIINETDVSPYYLGIEITESSLISNFEAASQKLQKLKDMGITIIVDDFGTGYSNLSYLLNLPISIIKIDKSFIKQLQTGSKTEEFIKMLIDISHKLGWEVVAEGVETELQFEMLKNLDCDHIQGYYFSKPVPEEQAMEYSSKFEM